MAVIVGVVLALGAFELDFAAGHTARSFRACVKSDSATRCREQYSFLPGVTLTIRARATPPHRDDTASLWRRRPEARRWAKVDRTEIYRFGGTSWRWDTTSRHVDRNDPWRFKYVIPGHAVSNVVRIFITPTAE